MRMDAGKMIRGTAHGVDERFGAANFFERNARKIFPDHWSFMLGEIALYSFIILVLTGVFLTLFFEPSSAKTVYTGPYPSLRGEEVSEAYSSTLRISFEVRGGLLMRQIHHWAALIFVAAVAAHALRIFFTGAFRRPREINWLIGVALFTIAIFEGFAGYSLPDDLLSGTGLRIAQGIILSIPVVGAYLSFFAFGGEFPGHDLIPRLFALHILLLPGLLVALISAHMMTLWHQKHTQWPEKGRTEHNIVGGPMFPHFMAKTTVYFLFIFGLTALLSGLVQINPIWLYGPYSPAAVSSGSQPDWYVGFLEGSLRIMPPAETVVAGHNISWNVLIPAVLYPAAFFTLMALYPFFERWATDDRTHHQLLDRPRNAPVRTGIGAAVIAAYGVTWAAGGDDVIANALDIPLYATTWFFRVAFIAVPVVAFMVARRACLGLQSRDRETLSHGVETGTVMRLPSGAYIEVTRGSSEEERAPIEAYRPGPRLDLRGIAGTRVPPPSRRALANGARVLANRLYTSDQHPPTEEEEEEAPRSDVRDQRRPYRRQDVARPATRKRSMRS
ncbi:MAG: ubiquinol-cytochrome c reductase cytochrome b subunit [Streptosporangiales bacterium]|nr:ubiquinol-cytochrome c reductase cytochrome b subunit [Streptosporangiales bacterium]